MTQESVAPVERVRPAEDASERDTLTGLLDFLRATVVNKVAGLTDEEAFGHPVPASGLSPAGLVKHLTGVERYWFSIDFADHDLPSPWDDGEPGGFTPGPGESLAQLVDAYRVECARSNAAVADAGLDDHARADGNSFTLRYALAHMVEETARHCGHLDLLRESIDGQTGE
ncbi:DinB family protein [Antribacter gilvus]|uniref:DinB family protein n=1 Tax=Antribacter gilvus TaxID=2304675 RepID=UPI000F7ABB4A|nr:DinB family protein [Antribacter gilvus]